MVNSSGYNFIVPTFTEIGSEDGKIDIQNIKLVDADGSGATDFICGMGSDGSATGDDYYWQTVSGSYFGAAVDGWYVGMSSDLATDVRISQGEGLYLFLVSDGAKAEYAGQVYEGDFTTDGLVDGYNIIGNCTPVDVDIQKIALVDADGSGATDFVCGMGSDGSATGEDLYWQTATGSYFGASVDGWYVGMSSDLATDVTVKAGQALYFYIVSTGAKVKIPSPIVIK